MNQALAKALEAFDGSPTALAAAIGDGVKRQNVEYWIRVGYVPAEQCPGVERASSGLATCEELCQPGLVWTRVPDKRWPWNKRGRPLLDVSRQKTPA